MKKFTNADVAAIFDRYPKPVREKMLFLRQLVFAVAAESAEIGAIEETTKWGEPSYMTKGGSTVRMDWKSANPEHYALYFHCKTKLVDTFKELYPDTLTFEGNRAIVFNLDDDVPVEVLKHCLMLSLTYHRRKHLPLLGV